MHHAFLQKIQKMETGKVEKLEVKRWVAGLSVRFVFQSEFPENHFRHKVSCSECSLYKIAPLTPKKLHKTSNGSQRS